MDEKLSFKEHDKINKAYAMLGLIKRNFTHLTTSSFILLYKNMDRSTQYGLHAEKSDVEALEKVKKRATKILPYLKQ